MLLINRKKLTLAILLVAAVIFGLGSCYLAQADTTCQPPALSDNQLTVECRSDDHIWSYTAGEYMTEVEIWRDIYGIVDGKLIKIKTIKAEYIPSHQVNEKIVWPDDGRIQIDFGDAIRILNLDGLLESYDSPGEETIYFDK